MPDSRVGEHLEQVWDAVAHGVPIPNDLDPTLADTARWLHALDVVPVPDAVFVQRLREELTRPRTQPLAINSPADGALHGLIVGRALRPPHPPGSSDWRGHPAFAYAATALMVVIALAAASVVFVASRREPETAAIVTAVSLPATSSGEASPESLPLWRQIPPPPVKATFVWRAGGPRSTGTDFSSQVAIDPTGNAWVLDGVEGRFQILGSDGTLLDTWGQPGSGEGQFDFQRDSGEVSGSIAFTPFHADEPFYVADSQNARIQQFAADRTFVRAWGGRGTGDGQFLEPIGVTVGYDGLVYVVDREREDVQVFDADGAFVRKFGGQGAGDGQFNQVGWSTFNPYGHFWIADTGNHRLQQFDVYATTEKRYRETIGSFGSADGELNRPQAVASDRDARLYVADRGNRRVQVFDEHGRFVGVIDAAASGGTTFHDPVGIAVSGDDFLYVLDDDGTTLTVQKFLLSLP